MFKKGVIGIIMCYGTCQSDKPIKNWSYRDDVGAHWGIKGYEEMVTEVGTEHGHMTWP